MSSLKNAVATDFRCVLGAAEFSFGGCDREAFQDILQFLCGLREDGLPGPFAASWKGGCASYELRRLDDGTIDSGAGRGLFVGVGERASASQLRGEGAGLSCGLESGSVGSAFGESKGCAGRPINDNAVFGAESVTEGPQGGVGQSWNLRVGGSTGGASCVDLDSFGGRGAPRGPNFLRNQANRMKKKVRNEERRLAEAEARGRREARAEAIGGQGSWRSSVARTPDEQRLHELKVKRQIIQEERKLNKLESPAQIVEDAVRQIAFAEKCAKMSNDSKVAAWAAALSTASAESLARSSGSFGVARDAASSVKSVKRTVAGLSVEEKPLCEPEQAAVELKILKVHEIVAARLKAGRVLTYGDFFLPSFPYRLTAAQVSALRMLQQTAR